MTSRVTTLLAATMFLAAAFCPAVHGKKTQAKTLLFATAPSGRTIVGAEPYRPQIGKQHADFTLPSIEDGAPIRLSQFRGKKVLLIHFASW